MFLIFILSQSSVYFCFIYKNISFIFIFQTPPSSPTSVGSRKSSTCSISSLNSSSSDSTHSPSSHQRSRSLSQVMKHSFLQLRFFFIETSIYKLQYRIISDSECLLSDMYSLIFYYSSVIF